MFKKMIKCLVSASMVLTMAMTSVSAKQDKVVVANGTQRAYVVGDDWGCGVARTVMALDQKIMPKSVSGEDFSVKQRTIVFGQDTTVDRKVLDAYVSDANGNKVTQPTNYVTIEMYISPDEGSPASFSLQTWRNNWADPYELYVSINEGQEITAQKANNKIVEINVEPSIDLQDMICPQLDKWDLCNDGFTASNGNVISYALFAPEADNTTNALVVWNHGIGETGEDVKIDMLCNEVTALGSDEFQGIMGGAYVLVPQRRSGTSNESVFELIKATVEANPDIDPNRVIVGGCSAGGACTLELLKAHADYFAAAYPVCAASSFTQANIDRMPALKTLPIFWIHAQNDGTVKFSQTEGNIALLEKNGNTNMHLFAPADVHDTTGRFDAEDGTPRQYDGHWSWVYFDNNEAICDECELGCWEWMAQQVKYDTQAVKGTQQVVVIGDDWGCGVTKTIMHLDAAVAAEDISADKFTVNEEKPVYGGAIAIAPRTILAAYTSDEKGNQVDRASEYVTIEMYISPSEGSPMIYSGRNNWCNPYNLYVNLTEGATIGTINTMGVSPTIKDIANTAIIPQLEGCEIADFVDENGGATNYALFTPKADDHTNALVIWNHGAGEYGTDVKIDLLCNEVTAYMGEEFQAVMDGAYVLVPQRRSGAGATTTKTVADLIMKVLAENPDIDPNRVIELGCSAGGMFTLQMEIDYPEIFAGAAPICPAKTINAAEAEIIKNIPNWFVHAENDTTVRISSSKVGMEMLAQVGAKEVHHSFFADVHDTTGRFDDEEGNPYQYAGHWSWIYADNNECFCDDEECENLNMWEWMSTLVKTTTVTIEGTQTQLHITGDDWGPGVDKTIIELEAPVKADDLAAENFTVVETKESTNWADFSAYNASANRTVTAVYLADEAGNKVDAEEGTIIAIEMYISPSEGSPFRYDVPSGSNKWCAPYELAVTGTVGNAVVVADDAFDLTDDTTWFCEAADKFDVSGSYTAKDGFTYQYATYTPAEDNKTNPLVIWLHGAGEGQAEGQAWHNDVYIDLLGNEVTAFAGDEFQEIMGGAYVLVPQCPTMWMSQPDTHAYPSEDETDIRSEFADGLFELIQAFVASNPDVNPDRIIIGGCSNGGYMTMNMIIDHPSYFYKAFPICEAYYDNAITDKELEKVAKHTGVWFTYALTDTTVDPTITSIPTAKRLADSWKKSDVHVTEWAKVEDLTGRFFAADGVTPYEYAGHWSWIYFDNNANEGCWEWLAK